MNLSKYRVGGNFVFLFSGIYQKGYFSMKLQKKKYFNLGGRVKNLERRQMTLSLLITLLISISDKCTKPRG